MASTQDLKASNLFSLKGFVSLVTGGGTGIGLMAAQALAANGSFSSVQLWIDIPIIMIPNQQAQKSTSQAAVWKLSKMQPGNIRPSLTSHLVPSSPLVRAM